MIFPFSAWRDGHNHHHATFGLIDIDTSQTILFTKKDYEQFSPPFKCFVRVVREPIVFFLFTVPFLWIFGTMLEYLWNRKSFVASMKLLGFGLFYFFASNTFIFCHYVSIVIGAILFHLQHSVNIPYRARKVNWVKDVANLEGSTYLRIPFFLKIFTNGIEYHHIHHINPLVPSYSIQACHETFTWKGINSVNYSQALNSLTNVMLDEDENRLVGF
jgi:omega-6 fatty acid desaturase (delta-12 desaturase)